MSTKHTREPRVILLMSDDPAFIAGVVACEAGVLYRSDNPHPRRSRERDAWRFGWDHSEALKSPGAKSK
jgi:hypothetical protein